MVRRFNAHKMLNRVSKGVNRGIKSAEKGLSKVSKISGLVENAAKKVGNLAQNPFFEAAAIAIAPEFALPALAATAGAARLAQATAHTTKSAADETSDGLLKAKKSVANAKDEYSFH